MNHIDAFSRRVGPGWQAWVRYSHASEPYPVTDGEKPKIFATALQAENAALRAALAHINGTLVRSGEIAKIAAEAKFARLFHKGREIKVEAKKGGGRGKCT
jgi:hypothetical protein